MSFHFPASGVSRIIAILGVLIVFAMAPCLAQGLSLSLSSSSGSSGATVTLNVSLAGAGSNLPASLDWTLNYPTADFSSVSILAGTAATAANKSVSCNVVAGAPRCAVWGLNSTGISNGIVATVSLTISNSPRDSAATVQFASADAADSTGSVLALSSNGGTVTIAQSPALNGFTCNATSVTPPATASCNVALTIAAPTGGAVISLSSSNPAAIVQSPVTIPAGAVSGSFIVSGASVAAATPVTLTASYLGVNETFGLTIQPTVPVVVSLNPGAAALTAGATWQFTATVTGASNTAVTWSLNPTAGSISGAGLYTAPASINSQQTVTVTATSVADISKSAAATVTLTPTQGPDLALNKTATQSSTYAPGFTDASKAVDGNIDGKYADGSLSHTNLDMNAWWQVDLSASASVSSIVVWNRTDCCGSRLSDYWVFVSNTPFLPTDTPTTLQNRAGTFSSHQTTQPNPSATITISGAQGRYVRVQLSGTNYLSLAEVQVLGVLQVPAPQDLAVGKTATQSSTYAPGFTDASKAADGNTDGKYADGSLTHTNLDANAWWQVDLGASATVNSIVVWNRTDCCSNRLSDYWVFVSDTPFTPTDTPTTLQNRVGTWSNHQTAQPNPSATIAIAGAQGRYVRVQLSGVNYLSLAEVQIFGALGQPSPDLALNHAAAQSSTYAPGVTDASKAVDGNTDGKYADGSLTHTNLDTNAWWQVDLGVSAPVSSIVVWNRTDCCASRLSDYWVFVSDTPFLPTDTPTTLQNRAGTWSSHQTMQPNPSATITVPGAQGRYVRVQLSGANYLSLAEVQVFGQ